jgi:serine protease
MSSSFKLKICVSLGLMTSAIGSNFTQPSVENRLLSAPVKNNNEKLRRIIVGFKHTTSPIPYIPASDNEGRVRVLSHSIDIEKPWSNAKNINYLKSIGDRSTVVMTDAALSRTEMQGVLQDIRNDSTVAYAEIDERVFVMAGPIKELAVTNDPYESAQWFPKGPSDTFGSATVVGGANLDIDRANAALLSNPVKYVGVVDTGINGHPDMDSNIIGGYDFISDGANARDGDGRDSNPRDEGDINYLGQDASCSASLNSTWHGAEMASLIVAIPNNNMGIAGLAPTARVVPVRAMGRCGGFDSDVIAAMNWAAGIPISGVPNNPYPASVLSVSLGGVLSCNMSYQSAISDIVAAGIPIVAATGNEFFNDKIDRPANCRGVISVTSHSMDGKRATNAQGGVFPNIGPGTTLSAPGKDIIVISNPATANSAPEAYTTINNGAFFVYRDGTSFSVPIVASVIVRMLQNTAALTPLEIKSYLVNTVRPFVSLSTSCYGNYNCGAGMLDGANAIAKAQSAIDPVSDGYANVNLDVPRGQIVTLTGSAQSGRSAGVAVNIVSADWTQVSGASAALINQPMTNGLAGPNSQPIVSKEASFTVPFGDYSDRAMTFRLRATDSQNRVSDSYVSVSMSSVNPVQIVVPNANADMVDTGGAMDEYNLIILTILSFIIVAVICASDRKKTTKKVHGISFKKNHYGHYQKFMKTALSRQVSNKFKS